MAFFPADRPVPEGLATDEFLLKPLTVAHVDLDYAALMVSVEMLRRWGGTTWPTDDFTVDDNRADLEYHDREHCERVAFTYTVLSPDEDECLGCVYVRPLRELTAQNPDIGQVGEHDAVVRFWVVQPRIAGALDRRLLDTLRGWFEREWPFSRVLFAARNDNRQHVQMMVAAGMVHVASVSLPSRNGPFLLLESP